MVSGKHWLPQACPKVTIDRAVLDRLVFFLPGQNDERTGN